MGLQGPLVILEQMVNQVKLVILGLLAKKENQGRKVHQDLTAPLAKMVNQAKMERMVPLEIRGHRGQKVRMVLMGTKATWALLELKDHRVNRV